MEGLATGREVKGGVTEGGGKRTAATRARKDGPRGSFSKDVGCRSTGADHAVRQSRGEGGPAAS